MRKCSKRPRTIKNDTAVLICSLIMLVCAGRGNASQPTLTSISAVHRMQGNEPRPVAAEGVVTDIGSWPYGLSFQDGDDGIYVALLPGAPRIAIGQRILVRGTSNVGDFAPIIKEGKIELKGRGVMPRPYATNARELSTGGLDNRLVEVRGVVRTTTTGLIGDGNAVFMVVNLNPGTVHVVLARGLGLDVTRFVDATIRASGVVAVEFNQKRQALGAVVVVSRLQDITVVRPPLTTSLRTPPTPIADIFRWGSNQDWSHRINVRGILTLQQPGEFLILQNGNQAIQIESPDAQLLPLGTQVNAAGFARSANFGPMLTDSVIASTGRHEKISPLIRKASQISEGGDNLMVVEVAAQLIERHESGTGVTLSLEDEGIRFVAEAPHSAARKLEKIAPGSWVQITGVNEVLVDGLRRPKGFRLLIRTAGDVVVSNPGPWLNKSQILFSALAFGTVALICALWALMLRSRVRSQTAWITESLRRERSNAWLHAERSKIFGLIGCNAPLQQVCQALVGTILTARPHSKAAIGIRSFGKWEWVGEPLDGAWEQAADPIELASCSGELCARMYLSALGTDLEANSGGDLIETCLECLAIALEHHDLHERLVRQSFSDPLTQLPNRRSLDSHLDLLLTNAQRGNSQFAILVMDMDGFKGINDTLGHAAGDIVLQQLGARFSSVIRNNDMIARIGGDEFVAVFENVNTIGEAEEVAARLRTVAARTIDTGSVKINPSLSLGIALYPADGETAQALKDAADRRMYDSKMERGHGRVRSQEVLVAK